MRDESPKNKLRPPIGFIQQRTRKQGKQQTRRHACRSSADALSVSTSMAPLWSTWYTRPRMDSNFTALRGQAQLHGSVPERADVRRYQPCSGRGRRCDPAHAPRHPVERSLTGNAAAVGTPSGDRHGED